MEALSRIEGETWFQLGDRDLAMHVSRTAWLRSGETLSDFATQTALALRDLRANFANVQQCRAHDCRNR